MNEYYTQYTTKHTYIIKKYNKKFKDYNHILSMYNKIKCNVSEHNNMKPGSDYDYKHKMTITILYMVISTVIIIPTCAVIISVYINGAKTIATIAMTAIISLYVMVMAVFISTLKEIKIEKAEKDINEVHQ